MGRRNRTTADAPAASGDVGTVEEDGDVDELDATESAPEATLSEDAAPTTADAPAASGDVAAKPKRYRVYHGTLDHDRELFRVGDEVPLTDAEAASLGHIVEAFD